MVGQTVSHYKIVEKLGQGGMGVVYKAQDTLLKRTVALKFLPASASLDKEARARFIREAQAASALEHANICTVHEIGECDGQVFIVMGYYDGQTLKSKIENGELSEGPLAGGIEEAVDIGIQAARGLARAHEAGITHRDVKPANIMVTNRGEVKILDFGIAKLSGQTMLTRDGATVGTAAYMSPEQASSGTVDPRSDLWSLGVVLYEMLAGRLPFSTDYESALIYSILNTDPPPLRSLRPEIPEVLAQIVEHAMTKDVSGRYQKAEELASDLEIFNRGGKPGEATQAAVTAGTRARKKLYRRTAVIGGGLIVLFFLAFFARWVLEGPGSLATPRSLAVISFENQTGLDSLNYLQSAIPNLLITGLENSQYLQVTSWDRFRSLLKRAGQEKTDFIDRALGTELCRMDDADAMVVGTIARAGELFVTDVKVIDTRSGQTLKTARMKGHGLESLLESQVDELTKEISKGAGLSASKFSEGQKPLPEMTTTSLEAYRWYLKGKGIALLAPDSAVVYLSRSLALDSNFASAYLWLGKSYAQYGDIKTAQAPLQKARSLAWKAPEKDRLQIEQAYANLVEQDRLKNREILEATVKRFPRETTSYWQLEGIYRDANLPEKQTEVLNKLAALEPDDPRPLIALTYIAIDQQRDTAAAFGYLRRYADLRPRDPNVYDTRGDLLLWTGKVDSAMREYRAVDPVHPPLFKLAYCAALKENVATSRRMIGEAIPATEQKLGKAMLYFWRALYSYWGGSYKAASRDLDAQHAIVQGEKIMGWENEANLLRGWIALDNGRLAEARLHFTYAYDFMEQLTPDKMSANSHPRRKDPTYSITMGLLELREKKYDSVSVRIKTLQELGASRWPTLLQAELLLATDSVDAAIACADSLPQAWMTNPNIPAEMYWLNYPYLWDVQAQAHATKGNLERAIQIYEQLINGNPADRGCRLVHPLYHYRLGKLYEAHGERVKAAGAYERFLRVWREADGDRRELGDAKKRLALLKRSGMRE
jgi:tetratricopeptide (TPR) repeat protein/tRNA A-37 threonylcarbamoyl transferase component Bud32